MESTILFDYPRFSSRLQNTNGSFTQLFFIKDFVKAPLFDDDFDEEDMVADESDDLELEECIERFKT